MDKNLSFRKRVSGCTFGRRSNVKVIPAITELPKERRFTDDRALISFTEFTIFETMQYDALNTVLSGGGKWNGKNPFE